MILPWKSAKKFCTLSLFFGLAFPSLANQPLAIPNIKASITFDGELNEPAWQQAKHVELNIVNYPYENTPSPIKTDAYIFEDGEHIYFAFNAQDPDPEKIQAFIRDRDDAFSDDIVGIKLDTFNDHRLAYQFFVNPYGVQNDGIENEMTGNTNTNWDGIWQSFGKITKTGYQVEFAIPYSELNFAEGSDIKTWGIELIRQYPRDNILRISNIPLNRDDPCWICQMAEMQGFEQAKIGNNVLITPSIVASSNEIRDVYSNEEWHSDEDVEVGLSVRWGITPDILLNATVNPDFSTVESDAGKLKVNKTYALFYDEKRPFFLDNAEYFSSPFNLVYTRNIADPDYGSKVTGRVDEHSFGLFITQDNRTNIILPGNLFSSIAEIDDDSFSAALRYRYDVDEDLSFGFISTLRSADDYANLVSGIDAKYKLSLSNSVIAQVLTSDSEYPNYLLDHSDEDNNVNDLSDQAYHLAFEHSSEDWLFNLMYQAIGKDFRADLGFLPKVDSNEFSTELVRNFYNDDGWWTEANIGVEFETTHNDDNELINETTELNFRMYGPWQSTFSLTFIDQQQVGLRFDEHNDAIDGNTDGYDLNQIQLYTDFQPVASVYMNFYTLFGDAIDYGNDRKGDIVEISPRLVWNITRHLEFNFNYSFAELEADGAYVFRENISDLRLTYAFDVNSFLRLTLVYTQTDYNLSNNPDVIYPSTEEDELVTELLYSYKLNPQTVFFLGYSDIAIEDDALNELKKKDRTAFLKLSYAFH
ncbi:carbohydrate binding family 9 domain-containing protein [Thalassotalea sp. ND16A]|uniref:carbohydrate binding family 9 domain-containing protein n=1 Tax=Thalassotalea sp. ND16A TaxID=1535422 RepID=UPI00051A2C66|nr:carbohydrate binding family 9 domain-containing protein [Thalassotalea sp. ND16A]KGJ88739.1 hypothetical protein ND16A_2441 [Thalassotalea sp. ND16A]